MATPRKTTPQKTARGSKAAAAERNGASAAAAQAAQPAPDAAKGKASAKRKHDILAAVVAATDARKQDVKPILEAAMAALGEALSRGEDVTVPPLGRFRVVKSQETSGGEVLTLKLRRRRQPQ